MSAFSSIGVANLFPLQHGFIKGRSCITQLLATLDRWTEGIDGGGDVDAVYLDFSKCFDSVPHERLLMKIGKYGIKGKLWDWVADFLRGRHQQVSIRGYLSAIAAVLSGIPQGSVLDPLLFVIFINEMPDMVHTCIQMFADDTKLFTHIKDESDVARLQDDLDSLQSWADAWQLRFNPDKCKVLPGSAPPRTKQPPRKVQYVYNNWEPDRAAEH